MGFSFVDMAPRYSILVDTEIFRTHPLSLAKFKGIQLEILMGKLLPQEDSLIAIGIMVVVSLDIAIHRPPLTVKVIMSVLEFCQSMLVELFQLQSKIGRSTWPSATSSKPVSNSLMRNGRLWPIRPVTSRAWSLRRLSPGCVWGIASGWGVAPTSFYGPFRGLSGHVQA